MAVTIAIASESPYDEAIYQHLASIILNEQVISWTGGYTFNGCKAVAKLVPAFLNVADSHGIRHAIVAVDNDGGARKRPEHAAAHVAPAFTIADDDTCRECWLGQAIPRSWLASGAKACVVVPVQALETWLLAIRGVPPFTTPTPEQHYHRPTLKKSFFGKAALPVDARISLAVAELQKPHAHTTLALRPSYQRFVAALANWP